MSNYYENNASKYIEDTINCDMSEQYTFFLKHMSKKGLILDIGFGSGRDMRYFKSLGYDTLVCPWKNMRGAASLGKFAKNEKLFGNLATTWGSIHGLNMQKIFAQAAYSGWGCGTHDINDRKNRMSFNHHVNQMNQDMECKSVY